MTDALRRLAASADGRLAALESAPFGRPALFLALAGFFALLHLSGVFVLREYQSAVFPLTTLYVSDRLLLPGGSLAPALGATVLSPANIVLDYPPAIYVLPRFLGSVRNIFAFLFLLQAGVPALVYSFLRRAARPLPALLAALLSCYYCVNVVWWTPDYILQPFMLLGAILLWDLTAEERGRPWARLAALGVLSGLITVIKHNEGVFWGAAAGAALLVRSVDFAGARARGARAWLYGALAAYGAFGAVFLSKQTHADAVVYYLLPFAVYWAALARAVAARPAAGFAASGFLAEAAVYAAWAAVIPGAVFLWVGGAVGYARYFASFGMGLDYRPIWDFGILGVLRHVVLLRPVRGPADALYDYNALLLGGLLLSPFLASAWAAARCWGGRTDPDRADPRPFWLAGALSVMGVFLLYPLEGAHILKTKLFLFAFTALYLLRGTALPAKACLAMALALLPVAFAAAAKPLRALRTRAGAPAPALRSRLGLRVEGRLAAELERQVAVLERSIRGGRYYVLDTSSSLTALPALYDNAYPQYYLEMRPGILNQEAADAMLADLRRVDFVVVRDEDYRDAGPDPYFRQLVGFVRENFSPVDRYEAPAAAGLSTQQVYGFLVMKRNDEKQTRRPAR